jgi:hypothetical protein
VTIPLTTCKNIYLRQMMIKEVGNEGDNRSIIEGHCQ